MSLDLDQALRRFEKLPKWVRDYIKRLERIADEATESCRRVLGVQTKTNIVLNSYAEQLEYVQSDQVTFLLGKDRIEVRHRGDRLEVRSWGSISDVLSVHPSAANMIVLKVAK